MQFEVSAEPNSVMVLDWSSISYHALFAMDASESKYANDPTAYVDEQSDEDQATAEKKAYINAMLSFVFDIIERINPLDLVLACEGSKGWRFPYLDEYYKNNTDVFYNSDGYVVRYDNVLARLTKNGDVIDVDMKHPVKDAGLIDGMKVKKLSDMNDRVQGMIRGLKYMTKNGAWKPLIPSYKGQRADKEWKFSMTKETFKKTSLDLAEAVSKLCRAYFVNAEGTEGDDAVFASYLALKDKYDKTIVVTCDSDMNQMLSNDNVVIYNHRKKEFVECATPKIMLECKILGGDTSDNINGMALPGKATKLGAAGAAKLAAECDDLIAKAESEGWVNQYIRNKTMIDFNFIPESVLKIVAETFKGDYPELHGMEALYGLSYLPYIENKINDLKARKYCVLCDRNFALQNTTNLTELALHGISASEAAEIAEASAVKRTFAF